MARSLKTVLGGRYELAGEFAREASVQRGWDGWLNRPVLIEILTGTKIDDCVAKRRFLDSARALVRIEHPNIEALLDYGATPEGVPYHVMPELGVDLATLVASEGRMSWARARGIMLDVIAGVDALHHQRIVHGGVSPHAVALSNGTARLVEFGDAERCEQPTAEQIAADVRGAAALGFTLLTGSGPDGRDRSALAAALAATDAPAAVRLALLRALTEPVELATLRRALSLRSGFGRVRTKVIDAAASVAAATMLVIGLWSSVASSSELGSSELATGHMFCEDARTSSIATAHAVIELDVETHADELSFSRSAADLSSRRSAADLSEDIDPIDHVDHVDHVDPVAVELQFESARGRIEVGSEAQPSTAVTMHSKRIELHRELSPASLVERGIDLTHGRPTPQDDPRVPIVDGPVRARALFEAACAREYGKGCHMLGVQIAEGMIADDGAGPAAHYRRGCALEYHRSCAALADLARAGEIDADADRLDAKACQLAGPASSYCKRG